jgi:hypothetical protein
MTKVYRNLSKAGINVYEPPLVAVDLEDPLYVLRWGKP